MRPYIKGENVEDYLVEMTQELVSRTPTVAAFVAPVLTTAERDAVSPTAKGMVVFNSSTGVLEFHDGTSWGAV